MDGVIVTTRKARSVASYAKGTHWPNPVSKDGVWRCADCGKRLRTYLADTGERRLRHYS